MVSGASMGQRLDWIKPYTKVKNTSFDSHNVSIKWFEDGTLNVSRQLRRPPPRRPAATRPRSSGRATTRPTPSRSPTASCTSEVCSFANVLKALGVKKGDRVTIYLPMIPEAAYAMLACARIGAVHSVVFAGFSPDSLADRIEDCGSKLVITADEGLRGGRTVPLKTNADEALTKCHGVDEKVLVVRRTGGDVAWDAGRDVWLHEELAKRFGRLPARGDERRGPAVHPLHLGLDRQAQGRACTPPAATSSTPSMTHQYVFDYHDGDIYWCTADVGWVTGHSYIVYGPLANGATTLMFEGVPNYPTPSASGRSSTSTRSTSSTPRPPPSAR